MDTILHRGQPSRTENLASAIGDPTLADSICNRLLHHAQRLMPKGPFEESSSIGLPVWSTHYEQFRDNCPARGRRTIMLPTVKTDLTKVASILFGVSNCGGGYVIIGGKCYKIPPRGPSYEKIQAALTVVLKEVSALG
jgi:hypothetical protein